MGSNETGAVPAPRRRRGSSARYIFQIDTETKGGVIRVLDRATDTVFREIPVPEFVRFAKRHKNVKRFLLGEAS
jgi:uncharacterized FlaG/YvyC family protein